MSRPNRSVRRSKDLVHGEDPRPDRRELDRERQTVEPAAQIHDRPLVGGGQLEPAGCCRSPLREELDRLVLAELIEGLVGLSSRQLERWDRQNVLTRNRQRLAAGGDHPHARRGLEDVGHEHRGRSEQVLAVVHHEQQLLVLQVREQEGPWLGRGLVAQVQGRQRGVADERGIPNLSELDQPCAVPKVACQTGPDPDREAGLADTARADEADQAGRGQLLPEFSKLTATADEARRFSRQVARAAGGPGHGESKVLRAVGAPVN